MTDLRRYDPGRLVHLAHHRDAAMAAARSISDRERDLRERRHRAVLRIDRLKIEHRGGAGSIAADEIARQQEAMAECDEALRQLAPALREARDEAGAAGRVFGAALRRAQELGLPMPPDLAAEGRRDYASPALGVSLEGRA